MLEDWLEHLRHGQDGLPVWLDLTPSRLLQDASNGTVRADALLVSWVRSLAAAASGARVHGLLVGRDAALHCTPLAPDSARATLVHLLQVWREGMQAPLPFALRSALAWVGGGDAASTYEGGFHLEGEGTEPCLARLYPDYETLTEDGRFEALAASIGGPLADWAREQVQVRIHPEAGNPAHATGDAA